MQPEPWLRGPLSGVDPYLMPAAHALTHALEDLARAVADVPPRVSGRGPAGPRPSASTSATSRAASTGCSPMRAARRCPTCSARPRRRRRSPVRRTTHRGCSRRHSTRSRRRSRRSARHRARPCSTRAAPRRASRAGWRAVSRDCECPRDRVLCVREQRGASPGAPGSSSALAAARCASDRASPRA